MSGQRTVMVIAGGEWQVPIVATAKRLGHRVVDTNLHEGSPAFAVADVGVVADVLDVEANLAIARRERPDAVITDQSDIAVRTVAQVADALGLRGIGVDVAERFTNKVTMRSWCRDLGVTQPRFASCRYVDDAERFAAEVGFPVVMKPPASQSSRGVCRVDDRSQLDKAFSQARELSSDESVLVEEFIGGVELTAEGIRTASGHTTLAISTKAHLDDNPMVARRLLYRSDDPEIPFDELRAVNDRLIDGMGLPFGLTHTEYKYHDGRFFLVETAARGGGTKVSSDIVPFISGIDTNALLVEMALGADVVTPEVAPGRRSAVLEFLTFPSGHVVAIDGVQDSRALPGVLDLGLTFEVGDDLEPPSDDRSRHLHVIATGDTPEDALAVVADVQRRIVVHHG